MEELPLGQGHGIEGRYAGLPDPYGNETSAQIVILPVPFDKTTTYQQGTDKGPAALIEASRNMELYDIETQSQVYEKGIFTAPAIIEEDSLSMLKAGYERTLHYLDKGKFVVTIGGEHSISFAPIKAHSERYPNLIVLQFDAHADLQKAYENNPWSHASVMARVKELPGVQKIVSVGIRSMSIEESNEIDPSCTFFAHEIDAQDDLIDQILEKLDAPVYISFDLDAFDSSLMPSTGTPEPGGLFWNQALKILKAVAKHKKIVGLDVVELCPQESNAAPDYLAAKLIYKTLSYIFKG